MGITEIINEIWKPIINYEDFYEISNYGRVKSIHNKNITNKKIILIKNLLLNKVKIIDITKILNISRSTVMRIKSGQINYINKILCPILGNHGYLYVNLFKDKCHSVRLVHDLVLVSFIGKRPEKMECRHLDGNRLNNKLSNLVWGTSSENTLDSVIHGTHVDNKGEKSGVAKLNNKKVWAIRKDKRSHKEIAKEYDIHIDYVSKIKTKKQWRHI